ncbi:MAG: hypothetical protein HFF08_00740 [Oscillospiraceae bacterium]|nr:hypothetical protein [Oscillospiraceae bacterium]
MRDEVKRLDEDSMENLSLKETIRILTRKHLEEHNGILLGECVSDPGGVAGTIPESSNVIDLPMTETAGADIAVGCALAGRRPIFVTRFQDFMLMNGSPIVYFAGVYQPLCGISAPVFVRALANDGFDATHSNVLHSLFMHFSGIKVCAPITPGEYKQVWNCYLAEELPYYVSEFRDCYNNQLELMDEIVPGAQLNVFGVSICRMRIREAKKILKQWGIQINIVDIMWLKPFDAVGKGKVLKKLPLGLVVDPGRSICGAAEHLAYELMMQYPGSHVEVLGVDDRIKTPSEVYQNPVPTAEMIANKVYTIIKGRIS